MNEIVTQKADALVPVTWNGERVLTTAQLAEFFATSTDNIKHIFHRNRSRFVEGVHYFKLEGDDLAVLRGTFYHLQISSRTRALYLWTKQGAARHSKSVDTDAAWQVFDVLERHYFDCVTRGDASGDATALEGTKCHPQIQNTTLSAKEQIDCLLKCAGMTDNPQLRDALIIEAAKLATGKEFIAVKS